MFPRARHHERKVHPSVLEGHSDLMTISQTRKQWMTDVGHIPPKRPTCPREHVQKHTEAEGSGICTRSTRFAEQRPPQNRRPGASRKETPGSGLQRVMVFPQIGDLPQAMSVIMVNKSETNYLEAKEPKWGQMRLAGGFICREAEGGLWKSL